LLTQPATWSSASSTSMMRAPTGVYIHMFTHVFSGVTMEQMEQLLPGLSSKKTIEKRLPLLQDDFTIHSISLKRTTSFSTITIAFFGDFIILIPMETAMNTP